MRRTRRARRCESYLCDAGFECLGDVSDLGWSKFRVHRQRERFAGELLGDGKGAGWQPEGAVAILQVNRYRVVNGAADAILRHCLENLITMRNPDDVEMPNVQSIVRAYGKLDTGCSMLEARCWRL